MATYPGNLRTSPIGDVLAWCAQQPLADVLAMLSQLRGETGLPVPALMMIPGGTQGPDAAGELATGNPVLFGGRESATGLARTAWTDSAGRIFVRPQGVDDINTARDNVCDRAGILAVAPPVSKLWRASGSFVAVVGTITQPAPGAGLRNVVLSWGVTLATGANAQPAIPVALNGGAAGFPNHSIACPANDFRAYSAQGPVIGDVAAAVTLATGGVASVAGAFLGLWMVGYVAAFP